MIFSQSGGLNDSVFGKSQAPIRLFLEKRGEAYENESMLKNLFQMNKSNHFGEKYTALTAMEGFSPVGENGAYPEDMMQEGFSKLLENETWKDSFAISREMVEDGVLLDMKRKPSAFVGGFYRTRERFGACLLGNAIVGNTTASFGGKSFDY